MIPHSKFKVLHEYLSQMDDRHGLQLLGEIKADFVDLVGQVRQWEPIETAPKDGSLVLLYDASFDAPYKTFVGCWVVNAWSMVQDPDSATEPTHWQPLPEAPQEEGS